MTSRPFFGDTAAPLYANLEGWAREAIDRSQSTGRRWLPFLRERRPVQQERPEGIVGFVEQLDAPARRNLFDAMWERAEFLWPPIALAGLVIAGVALQLALGKQLPAWAVASLLPIFAFCINLSVARIDGGQAAVFGPFQRLGLEYYGDIGRVRDQPAAFVRDYPRLVDNSSYRRKLSGHARTHPPGPVLFLWSVDRYIGGGLEGACYAAIIVSALGSVPAYLLARHCFGNTAGVIAGAMYLLTPSLVIFGATCMDGVFATPMIASIWLLAAATTRRAENVQPRRWIPGWRDSIYAVIGGIALTVAAFMSYASACICIVFATYVLVQLCVDRRWATRSLIALALAAGVFVACNLILYVTVGYDPIACVRASIRADASVVDRVRAHWIDVSVANLVAFFVGTGLITTTLWLRSLRALCKPNALSSQLLAAATLIAMIGVSFSRLFTLETERIWIFLMPIPIAAAASSLARGRQVATTVQVSGVLIVLFLQTWLAEALLNTWW